MTGVAPVHTADEGGSRLTTVPGVEDVATALALSTILMPSLGWRWVLLVGAGALAWFVTSDRIKLVAYRFLDRTTSDGRATADSTGGVTSAPCRTSGTQGSSPTLTPFHSGSHEVHPAYRDRDDCPDGVEISGDGDDEPGSGGRLRCAWCAGAIPVPA